MGSETCAERICKMYVQTMRDISNIVDIGLYSNGSEDQITHQYMTLEEYSLCFDFIKAGEIGNEKPCFRWQLSWGGPQDEFLFPIDDHIYAYSGGEGGYRYDFGAESTTQYWLRDWGDSAHINIHISDSKNNTILQNVIRTYGHVGACAREFRKGGGIPNIVEPF